MRLARFGRMWAAMNHGVVSFGAQTDEKQHRTSHRGSKQKFLSP
jgi:hypothetical protein